MKLGTVRFTMVSWEPASVVINEMTGVMVILGSWTQKPLTWFDTGGVGYTEDTGYFGTTGDAEKTAEATLGW